MEKKISIRLFKSDNIFILSHPKPVGYLNARVTRDGIEIISILVDKKFRAIGIGKSLLKNY